MFFHRWLFGGPKKRSYSLQIIFTGLFQISMQLEVQWPGNRNSFPSHHQIFLITLAYYFYRDTLLWVKAVDFMRKLKPETLVPQHTRWQSLNLNVIFTLFSKQYLKLELWIPTEDNLSNEFLFIRPLEGKEVIMETLTAYRDAIQIVHDQTVRYMNKGILTTILKL